MAAEAGAAPGLNVQHDEYMEGDDPLEGSGDEDPDARGAQDPQPIEEDLEELTVAALYATDVEEWKSKVSELTFADTRAKIQALALPEGFMWKNELCALRATKAACNTGLASVLDRH